MKLNNEHLEAVSSVSIVCDKCGAGLTGEWTACDGDAVLRIDRHICNSDKDSIKTIAESSVLLANAMQMMLKPFR